MEGAWVTVMMRSAPIATAVSTTCNSIGLCAMACMTFGSVTLALGIGLMALVFISSRRGYDEIGRKDG